MWQNKIQSLLETFGAFIILNILWLLFCLPIVTIFPATITLFSIVRGWSKEGIDYQITKQFLSEFKENWKRYFWMSLTWLASGFILLVYYYFILSLQIPGKSVLIGLLFISTFLYIGMTIYCFSLSVHFELSHLTVIKNAFFLSIGRIGSTIFSIFIVLLVVLLSYFFSLFFWISGSVAAYAIYLIISKRNAEIWFKGESELTEPNG
ncbi:hypothetical protein BTS2_1101 [Bacillus sp. TS-2]|nr:hypothetical protein BTS2_1101 [Bacillus sp. TS-2]